MKPSRQARQYLAAVCAAVTGYAAAWNADQQLLSTGLVFIALMLAGEVYRLSPTPTTTPRNDDA